MVLVLVSYSFLVLTCVHIYHYIYLFILYALIKTGTFLNSVLNKSVTVWINSFFLLTRSFAILTPDYSFVIVIVPRRGWLTHRISHSNVRSALPDLYTSHWRRPRENKSYPKSEKIFIGYRHYCIWTSEVH